MTNSIRKLAFVSSGSPAAEQAFAELTAEYGNTSVEDCDALVVLGGDGFVLYNLHEHLDSGKPIYGMNRGTVGFLLNEYSADNLVDRINAAKEEELHPLTMVATTSDGQKVKALAFNEVSVLRSSRQSPSI